jgi:hypothetical protein
LRTAKRRNSVTSNAKHSTSVSQIEKGGGDFGASGTGDNARAVVVNLTVAVAA